MKSITENSDARKAKREAIEAELAKIIKNDRDTLLLQNLKSRHRGNFLVGDRVILREQKYRSGELSSPSDKMYHVCSGTVTEVTESGYLIDGVSVRGVPARDFVNHSHLINRTVIMTKE